MRRSDREITGAAEKLKILGGSKVCRLGLAAGGEPYIVPLNFGWSFNNGQLVLYFHGANEGKKLDIMRNNNRACFEVDGGHALIDGHGDAFKYSFAYESVIGSGHIEFLESLTDKTYGLNRIMQHQSGKDTEYTFTGQQVKTVTVYRLVVDSFTGKRRNAPAAGQV
ncbi:pyridoxamine 5'-phosphate oxidase [Spirochaetia bacterium]|nr:pyridoxamine 5'-phosphate oxidase [Spirochaetia bacterium]